MYIIFGVNFISKKLGQKSQACNKCRRPTAHTIEHGRTWLTLFFIPVIPFGRKRTIVRCNLCGKEGELYDQSITSPLIDQNMIKCPDCAELINVGARVCRYCGYRFTDEEMKSSKEKVETNLEAYKEESHKLELLRNAKWKSVWAWILACFSGIFLFGIIGALADPTSEMTVSGAIIGSIIFVLIPAFFAWRLFRKARTLRTQSQPHISK